MEKVSVCVTSFREKEKDIKALLLALSKQTLKPDEIIITDVSNSKLQTLNSKQYTNLKYINYKQQISRAKGRNKAIRMAKNEIIAVTDIGCVPRKDWLERIVKPFRNKKVNVVAGYYKMTYENSFQKAMRVFLGILPEKFDKNYMPSARSMAFTKKIWKKSGGFPEKLGNTAEDTLFNVNLINANAKFSRVKSAVVEWGTAKTILNFYFKIFNYARGDAESGIFWHPVKRFQSHNIKILLIYLRYIVGFWLLIKSLPLFFLYAVTYSLYAVSKAGLWGLVLQPVSDFAVIAGFLRGIIKR